MNLVYFVFSLFGLMTHTQNMSVGRGDDNIIKQCPLRVWMLVLVIFIVHGFNSIYSQ